MPDCGRASDWRVWGCRLPPRSRKAVSPQLTRYLCALFPRLTKGVSLCLTELICFTTGIPAMSPVIAPCATAILAASTSGSAGLDATVSGFIAQLPLARPGLPIGCIPTIRSSRKRRGKIGNAFSAKPRRRPRSAGKKFYRISPRQAPVARPRSSIKS
ncbi:MAG: hypothetical protein JWL90_2714 [Chthoniobacteraceae bacterium]|nr:hypothetical protein [Chthoniobacteraceae bacterium]